jgi:hypothetical protein
MANPNNPLRQVYDAIWTLLEANTEFEAEMEDGNKIKLNVTQQAPWFDEVSTADLPESRGLSSKITGPHQQTSNASFMTAEFKIEVSTGDQGQYILFDVLWAVYEAMRPWEDVLTALTWNDKTFVHLAKCLEAPITEEDGTKNRGIQGWSCAWRGYIEMHFTSTDLGT